jgi:Cysteine-rich secretory protein family
MVVDTSTYNQKGLRRVQSEGNRLHSLYLQAAIDAGVFASTRCLFPKKDTLQHTLHASSSSTLSLEPGATQHVSISWKSSGSSEHNRDAPLLVSNPDLGDPIVDQAKCLGRILERSRHLPKSGNYSNNHIMVNEERIRRSAAPLIRMHELDEAARAHAEAMVKDGNLFHMDPDGVLKASLKDRPCRRLGENVAKGKTIREMHQSMMQTIAQKNNILDRRFTHMGMATAHGPSGELYMCQVFRG